MQTRENTTFYGLLYIDEDQKDYVNIRGGSNPLDIYLRCAVLCARSFAHHGYSFRLVTNKKSMIERRIEQLGIAPLDILQHCFSLNVPKGLPFRTAHFKLELYKLLGTGSLGEHVGVVDVDTVMIAPFHFPFLPKGAMMVYDITDQVVQEYGVRRLQSDLERVSGTQLSNCRWFGGEFMCGHAQSFRMLSESVFGVWSSYIEHVTKLHHTGDEMVMSAAVPGAHLTLIDAGQLGVIVRWWTARTNFEQIGFDAAIRRCILHLPADKRFLADYADHAYCPTEFVDCFRRAARSKVVLRQLFSLAEGLLGRRRKYVARLGS